MSRKSTTKEDVAVLQEQVREIKDNHLVHLAADIKNLDSKIEDYGDAFNSKIDRGMWLAITVLAGVVVTLGTLWLK